MKTISEIETMEVMTGHLGYQHKEEFNKLCLDLADVRDIKERRKRFDALDKKYTQEVCGREFQPLEAKIWSEELDDLIKGFESIEKGFASAAGALKGITEQKQQEIREKLQIDAVRDAVRNRRMWIDMFGGETMWRIDALCWVSGDEPCYEPLTDPTEEEEKEYARQVDEIALPLAKAIQEEIKKGE